MFDIGYVKFLYHVWYWLC